MTAALGAKDAYVQRGRAVLTVASLALAGAMVVCALAFETTMDRLAADPALRAQPWEVAVFSDSMPAERGRPRCWRRCPASRPSAAATGCSRWRGGLELETRVIDGSPDAFAFAVPDGRGVRRAGEVTLGRGALEQLGVEIGDRVTLTADGGPFSARVVGRHIEPDDDGLGVVTLAGTVPAASLRLPELDLAGAGRPRARPGGDRAAGGRGACSSAGPASRSSARSPRCARSSTA